MDSIVHSHLFIMQIIWTIGWPLFWLQLLNHGVSFINCSAAICMQQAVPTLLEILYWRLLTYIIKSFDLFFSSIPLNYSRVSYTKVFVDNGWTTSGEAASHPVNLIRLGNIHLYVLVVCDDQTRVSGGCQWYIERRRPISFSSSTWNRIEPRNVKVLPKKFPIVVTFLSLVEFYHPISSSI